MSEVRRGILFTVLSVLGTRIRLTGTQWRHIRKRRELKDAVARIKETLTDPDAGYYVPGEESYHYYRFYVRTPVGSKILLVVAKHLNSEGFVITAFYVRRLSKPQKVLLYESLQKS